VTVREAKTKLQPLVGLKAWGVAPGEGSFVTLEFGQPVAREGRKTHGEWHLWVYRCAWRIDGPNGMVAGSEDERATLSAAVAGLDGRQLDGIDILDSLEAIWTFGDLSLRLFPCGSELEHWMVFTPDGRVITAGPGNQLVDEPA
jgi:hypothetical protein